MDMSPALVIAECALWVLAVPACAACAYLLAACAFSARLPVAPRSSRAARFDIIVPAHNEEAVISRTLRSLRAVDWPADQYRVTVVADNCTDATAAIARSSGARVLERSDFERRGKGYALDFAFSNSARESWAQAVVVVDADSEVSANFLEAIAARLEQGASAIQVHYGVLNPTESWRTRLITIAKAAFHIVRSRSRERLKLSCGIRGNGWCVTHDLLRRIPYRAFSVTEDIEYGIDLGLGGCRVHYADEAECNGEMASNAGIAQKQRQRWEGGRFKLIRSRTAVLLRAAWRDRSRVDLDLALDLLVLPLSYVTFNVMGFLAAALLAAWLQPGMALWIWPALACLCIVTLYVLRGWQLSGTGIRGLIDLAAAPLFLGWKLASTLSRSKSSEWVKTDRERT
jgi:cellulose synthase/poly-beta-1,6-N-acetylglucosamine synthase-like glycosyltransferase